MIWAGEQGPGKEGIGMEHVLYPQDEGSYSNQQGEEQYYQI